MYKEKKGKKEKVYFYVLKHVFLLNVIVKHRLRDY